MIKEEIRGENYLLAVDGDQELSGRSAARTAANVFVRDTARNRLELWQACRVAPADPEEDFIVEVGRGYLRKTVFSQSTDSESPIEVWLRVS
jgi:hypothetical protein